MNGFPYRTTVLGRGHTDHLIGRYKEDIQARVVAPLISRAAGKSLVIVKTEIIIDPIVLPHREAEIRS